MEYIRNRFGQTVAIYPMMIINDVVIGTDTVLVSFVDFFEDVDDVVDTAVSIKFLSFGL